jgi:hypothetical protein
MVQFRFLSGPKAGSFLAARRFPFRVGRAADNDLCLDMAGVWDHHFVMELQRGEGFILQACDQAYTTVNDQPQTASCLRNGDVISFGAAKLQFWLAAPVQRGLRFRELFVWTILILVTLGQFAIIYFLLKLD